MVLLPKGDLATSGSILGFHNLEGGLWIPQALSEFRLGSLLNILQCTEAPTPTKTCMSQNAHRANVEKPWYTASQLTRASILPDSRCPRLFMSITCEAVLPMKPKGLPIPVMAQGSNRDPEIAFNRSCSSEKKLRFRIEFFLNPDKVLIHTQLYLLCQQEREGKRRM